VIRRLVIFALVAAVTAGGSAARASERVDVNATGVRLAVNPRGVAMVTYRARGRTYHLLVRGAVNALPPSQTVQQVHFRLDWSGGWKTSHRLVWKHFRNRCGKYDGPELVYIVAACKAPDGSYWALQAWQPYLPHRGYPAWLSRQTEWELHVSHWRGPLAKLEAYADWAFNGQAHDLFGRLTYLGDPVYGFGIGKNGAPNDRTDAACTSTRSTRPTAPAGSARRRSRSAGAAARSVTASGRRATTRCRGIRTTRARPETASATASPSKGRE